MDSIKLNSGYSIPVLGLGTWLLTGRECYESATTALEIGYTFFDTAAAYNNEIDIGKAIEDSEIDRSTLYLSTKIWYQKMRYRDVIEQCKLSLENLRTDYIDLLLIHWPNRFVPMKETFEAFELLVEERKVRSIGVCNFTTQHIDDALKSTSLPIAVNQVEIHPFFYHADLISHCQHHGIKMMAFSPLARGDVIRSELLKKIAFSKNTTVPEIALSWLIKKGIIVIPKAASEDHLRENIASVNVSLSAEDVASIDTLTTSQRIINPSWAEFD